MDYYEDSNADSDANFVFNSQGKNSRNSMYRRKEPISSSQFSEMFKVSKESCLNIFKTQLAAVRNQHKNYIATQNTNKVTEFNKILNLIIFLLHLFPI